jgi:hypothetical protein
MVKNLEVKENIPDKRSLFNIKKFKIGNLEIERPVRTVDARIVERRTGLLEEVRKDFQKIIFERSRLVTERDLKRLLLAPDKEVNRFFKFRIFMKSYPHIFPHTFNFNPLEKSKNLEVFSGYFSYLHSFSDPLLLIPNIKIEMYEEESGKRKRVTGMKDYIKFVHEAYRMLDYRNRKPIFVPLSLRFGIDEVRKIAKEYIRSEYYSVWIDFEGAAITPVKVSKIRSFIMEFEQAERLNDLVVFTTNIKREIISNIRSERTPASDVLAPLVGSNLVGVNKEPPKPFAEEIGEIKGEDLRKHKARVFDSSTYYYLKLDVTNYNVEMRERLLDFEYNIFFNLKLIDQEFSVQAETFLKEGNVEEYITKKQMIKEYRDGELGKILFRQEERISEWF